MQPKVKDIAIYGAGGLGREIASMIEKINRLDYQWNFIGFFDDGKPIGTQISHFGCILGSLGELNQWQSPLCVILAFGNPQTLYAVRHKIDNHLLEFPNIISPDFEISDVQTFEIGLGNIIKGGCFVSTDVKIGNYNLLNGSNVLGHDVKVGDYNVVMPGARISGEVTISERNLLGSDCFIKQQIKIGHDVTISPLSALLTKPKDNNTYIGNPAKIFKY